MHRMIPYECRMQHGIAYRMVGSPERERSMRCHLTFAPSYRPPGVVASYVSIFWTQHNRNRHLELPGNDDINLKNCNRSLKAFEEFGGNVHKQRCS